MHKKTIIKDIIKFVFFIGLGALFVWLFCRKLTAEEYRQIFDSFRNANYWWLVVALIFGVGSHLLRAWRWDILLKPLGYKPRFWNIIFSVCTAYFANLAVPRLGEITRCGMLTKYEKIPFAKSFGTVITERVCDMIVFGLLFVINILVQKDRAMQSLHNINSKGSAPVKTMIIIGVLVLIVILLFIWMHYVHKHNISNKFVDKIVNTVKGFADGMKSLLYIKQPMAFIVSSILIWVCYLYMTKMVFYALPETASLGYDTAMSSLAFSTIGILIIPGGIGIYPVLVSAVLSLYGIQSTVGFAMGWMIWTNQTVIVIIAGIISLIVFPIYNRKVHDSKIPTTENC